jgi:2,3-bisphosphoglycerate-dependent phosphoglycerate mutase
MYIGALQGLDKQETVDKYGKDQVLVWRRSYDVPPPVVDRSSPHHPDNDPRYAGFKFEEEFTESLATTLDRVVPYWNEAIVPEIKAGKTVLIAAHGNSLRALVKHLDGIDESTIAELNIPTGTPLVYELDDNLKPIPQPGSIAPLQGRYLGDQDAIRARIEGVKNQTK